MSRIYFHGMNNETAIKGSERAHFGLSCSDIAWSILKCEADEWENRAPSLRNVFPINHYVHHAKSFSAAARVFFSSGFEGIQFENQQIEIFSLNLNTAYFMGSNPVKLASRLHGQCEAHAYVEGPNRKWLANIIREGRKFKFFRDDMGWEDAIELLEQNGNNPIVTSYSVCRSFPNECVANFDGSEESWDELSDIKKWELGIEGLRNSDGRLELTPEDWDGFYFGDGIDANLLVAKLQKAYSVQQENPNIGFTVSSD